MLWFSSWICCLRPGTLWSMMCTSVNTMAHSQQFLDVTWRPVTSTNIPLLGRGQSLMWKSTRPCLTEMPLHAAPLSSIIYYKLHRDLDYLFTTGSSISPPKCLPRLLLLDRICLPPSPSRLYRRQLSVPLHLHLRRTAAQPHEEV